MRKQFIAALYFKYLARISVKSYLAAIHFSQIAVGMGDLMLEWLCLSYVIWDFKRGPVNPELGTAERLLQTY